MGDSMKQASGLQFRICLEITHAVEIGDERLCLVDQLREVIANLHCDSSLRLEERSPAALCSFGLHGSSIMRRLSLHMFFLWLDNVTLFWAPLSTLQKIVGS